MYEIKIPPKVRNPRQVLVGVSSRMTRRVALDLFHTPIQTMRAIHFIGFIHNCANGIKRINGVPMVRVTPTSRARDTTPQAVLLPTVSLLSHHTNLEPWEKNKHQLERRTRVSN